VLATGVALNGLAVVALGIAAWRHGERGNSPTKGFEGESKPLRVGSWANQTVTTTSKRPAWWSHYKPGGGANSGCHGQQVTTLPTAVD